MGLDMNLSSVVSTSNHMSSLFQEMDRLFLNTFFAVCTFLALVKMLMVEWVLSTMEVVNLVEWQNISIVDVTRGVNNLEILSNIIMEASDFENTGTNVLFVCANVFRWFGTYNVFDSEIFHVNHDYFVNSWPSEGNEIFVDGKSFWFVSQTLGYSVRLEECFHFSVYWEIVIIEVHTHKLTFFNITSNFNDW